MIRNPEKCIGDIVPSWELDHDVIEEYTDLVNELYDKHGIGCVYEIADKLKENTQKYGGRISRKDAELTAWQILARVKL